MCSSIIWTKPWSRPKSTIRKKYGQSRDFKAINGNSVLARSALGSPFGRAGTRSVTERVPAAARPSPLINAEGKACRSAVPLIRGILTPLNNCPGMAMLFGVHVAEFPFSSSGMAAAFSRTGRYGHRRTASSSTRRSAASVVRLRTCSRSPGKWYSRESVFSLSL